jgi:hypothetical protein
MDDFSKFQPTDHMFKWLDSDPHAAIRSEVESILQQQIADSRLISFAVTSDPEWLTAARRAPDDSDKVILVRTGVAFEFELLAQEPNGAEHKLQGTYTWVGIHLDDPENARQRVWFDLGANLGSHGSKGELQARLRFE